MKNMIFAVAVLLCAVAFNADAAGAKPRPHCPPPIKPCPPRVPHVDHCPKPSSNFSIGLNCPGISINIGTCHPRRVWMPGHYETICESILVEPGHLERKWNDEKGKWEIVWIPSVYETIYSSVWIHGYWKVLPIG